MGISLKSIELSNIRSHTHFKFTPADSGITALSGPTGSGKSTIVDSLAWTLYGTKPNGVSKNSAIYREGADFKKDKAYAIAELEVDGVLMKVERKMVSKAGGVRCDVWEWNTKDEDWEHKAGAATSHAENYIRQRLKMDEKGFLTAVLVQQKQVDQLISSGPSERAKVIEKLTGIASISSGITAARKEHTGLKKAIELTSVDESQLTAVETELSEAESKLKKIKKKYKTAKTNLQSVHEVLTDFELKVTNAADAFEAAEGARNTLSEVEVKLEASESILADAKTEKDEAKKDLPQGTTGTSLEESTLQLRKLKKTIADLEGSKRYQAKLLKDLASKESRAKSNIEESEYSSIDSLKAAIEAKESESSNATKKLKKYTADKNELRGEMAQLRSAITVVEKGDDCPTCRQSVANVTAAVDALEAQIAKIDTKLESLKAKIESATKAISDSTKSIADLRSLEADFETLEEVDSKSTSANAELSNIESDLKAASVKLKAAEKMHKIVEREAENTKRYELALQRLQKTMRAIENLKSKASKAKETLSLTKAPSEKKLESLRKKLYTMQVEYQDERVQLGELKSDARVLSSSITHLTEKKDIYTKELERHKELLLSVEISTATLETLTEFRADRVKTALPTIESYASELLTRFTDGKFVALKLDEKFNASVVLSSGAERPVGMLSGGELSAASIALRLSVSMMLNASDSNNLIILDEVLVSQDLDRSELILSTIKDVCKGQVVMIAHGAGVSAIADKKVDLAGS